jgi:hypothetical protein
MLIGCFKSPLTLERYRSASVAPHLDAFTAWRDEQGYGRVSVRRHVREVVHFATWAKKAEIPVAGLHRAALDRLRSYLVKRELMHHRNGGHQHLYQSACVFVGFLEATGVARGLKPTPKIPTPAERLCGEFTDWVRTQRGTMSSTLVNYRLPVMTRGVT